MAMQDHFWSFFCLLYHIFHKTEVQTVILRCLTGLNLDSFKTYDSKCKYFHICFLAILQKKNAFEFFGFWFFFPFCVIIIVPIMIQTSLGPQNVRLNLSFVKDIHIVGKKIVNNGPKTATLFSVSFRISLYVIIFTLQLMALPVYSGSPCKDRYRNGRNTPTI